MRLDQSFPPPLPKQLTISGHNCLIIHDSQNNYCGRCKKTGHQTNDSLACPYYEKHDIVCINSPLNPLCNYYVNEMVFNDIKFKSSDHCYQWKKATDLLHPDIAQTVMDAHSPEEAKQATKNMDDCDMKVWANTKLEVMEEILEAKLVSDESFKTALLKTRDLKIIKCTKDTY